MKYTPILVIIIALYIPHLSSPQRTFSKNTRFLKSAPLLIESNFDTERNLGADLNWGDIQAKINFNDQVFQKNKRKINKWYRLIKNFNARKIRLAQKQFRWSWYRGLIDIVKNKANIKRMMDNREKWILKSLKTMKSWMSQIEALEINMKDYLSDNQIKVLMDYKNYLYEKNFEEVNIKLVAFQLRHEKPHFLREKNRAIRMKSHFIRKINRDNTRVKRLNANINKFKKIVDEVTKRLEASKKSITEGEQNIANNAKKISGFDGKLKALNEYVNNAKDMDYSQSGDYSNQFEQ